MRYDALLQLLLAHPKTFLKAHYLMITVLGSQVFGPCEFYFGGMADANDMDRPLRRGRSVFTKGSKVLSFVPLDLRFQIALGDDDTPKDNIAGTWVYPVPVVHAATVGNYTQLDGDLVPYGGHRLMITTLLNGCSFCCTASLGGVLMKHIKPDGTLSHSQLAQALDTQGAFQGHTHGELVFFGSGGFGYDEGSEDVTIIGVRDGTVWKVYAQVHHRGARSIKRVVKFFEG